MNLSIQPANVLSYCVQVAVLTGMGAAAVYVLRVRTPKLTLVFWRTLLFMCLLLPAIQSWEPAGSEPRAAFALSTDSVGVADRTSAIALWLLALGVILRLAWLGMGIIRLRAYRRDAHSLPPSPVLRNLQEELGVSARFFLLNDERGPATWGVFRPDILLPAGFVGMDVSRQEALACHELIHVRRRDWVWTLLEQIVASVLWFHPAIWWLLGRIQLSREQCVDREVIEHTKARQVYLETLLDTVCVNKRHLSFAASFVQEGHLRARVNAIQREVSMSRFRFGCSAASLGIALFVAIQAATWSCSLQSPPVGDGDDVVHKVAEGVETPKLTHKVEPEYTEQARDAKLQGTAILAIEVWPDGRAHNIKVERPLNPGLDQKAIEAIRQWRFEPGTKDGKPIKVRANIEVNFRLL